VARAKRTDRAEARRRYRATIIDSDQPFDPDLEPEEAEERPRAARPRPAAPAPAAARPGIVAAFRGSFRPIDLRGDIAALPWIARHSKAIWLPVLLTVGSAAFYAAVTPRIVTTTPTAVPLEQVVATLLFQYFVFTPPVASIFLAGFLAPRASYLTGLIAGLVGAFAVAVVALITVGQLQAAQTNVPTATVDQVIQAAFVVSPISGLFFGGAAGWYKRFLSMANPNRAAARPAKPGDRNRRRDENNRPLLARRR
jgi:hypothetical protein